ncbi:hypothetical protein B1B_07170, partial [mine drainage metagenome]
MWGHADQQAMLWAQINPHSARAQAYAAQFEAGNGQPVDAQRRLLPLLAAHPDQVQLAFNLLNVQCQLGGVTAAAAQSARTAMATMRNPGTLLTSWFGRALGVAQAAHCPGFDVPLLQSLVDAGLGNTRLRSNPGRQQDLYYIDGQIALARGAAAAAQGDFERALGFDVRPGFAAEAAAQLGSAGHPRRALALLDRYQQVAAQASAPGLGMGMIHAGCCASRTTGRANSEHPARGA